MGSTTGRLVRSGMARPLAQVPVEANGESINMASSVAPASPPPPMLAVQENHTDRISDLESALRISNDRIQRLEERVGL